MINLTATTVDIAVALALGAAGVGAAWWLRRSSSLSIRNLYPAAALGVLLLGGAVTLRWWTGVLVLMPACAPWVGAVAAGRRWRAADLGAGEELRNHELGRRWVWEPRPDREHRERLYLRGQGELVRERPWPAKLEYVSMTARGEKGPRLPLGAGQHVMLVGATGAGKTTTARRLIATRTLEQDAAVLILDQKGDPEDVEQMERLAARAAVPFILFDSQNEETDRWQPLWGTPDSVAARAVEPIRQSEPYYYDALRRHLDIVCKVLHAAIAGRRQCRS